MNLMTTAILKRLKQQIKDDELIKFYHSKPWRTVRAERLKLDHNECQECKRRGTHRRGTIVHHKQHVRDRPDLALMLSNTETVCAMDHNREHPEKLQEFHEKKFNNDERW